MRRAAARLSVGAALLACAVGASACEELLGNGTAPTTRGGRDGGTTTTTTTGPSAFGSIVVAGATTSARLDVVVLGSTPRYATGIESPRLVVGQATVPLGTGDAVGVFGASSARAAALTWTPGATYAFAFDWLDEDGAIQAATGSVTAPGTRVGVSVVEQPIRFAGEAVEVELDDVGDGALVRVLSGSNETYSSAGSMGLDDVAGLQARLRAVQGPLFEVPGSAFPDAGTYTIEVTGLTLSQASSGLGSASWFGAGSVASVAVEVR